MRVRVKICGITNLDDAWAAVEAGADALGFVFASASPRCVTPATVREIIAALPPFVSKVGLFANADLGWMASVIQECGLDTLQLHGDEPPGFWQGARVKVIKAFRIKDESSLHGLRDYRSEAWLLDSYVPGKLGGTGERFNWELARIVTEWSRQVVLAGGLTPANVADAVRQVKPYAVDVSSGVESAPGRKDAQKLREFVRAAKEALA